MTLHRLLISGIFLSFVLLAGCNSSTNGGENRDPSSGEFVSTDSTAGSLRVTVTNTSLPVAGTSGFLISVTDENGAPTPNIQVSCDSEASIAIINPLSGVGLTDANGGFSGTIGCAAPGSAQFGCRLLRGGRRRFVSINCTGDIPEGFAGFPGAAGGGLGGGVANIPDNDTGNVFATSLQFFDAGDLETSGTSIDIFQGVCGEPPDLEAEPFFDTAAKMSVTNNTQVEVRFTSAEVTFDGRTSTNIAFLGTAPALDGNGGSAEFSFLIFDAESGGKQIAGDSTLITTSGVRNVRVTLVGRNSLNEPIRVTARTAGSFDNFDRCTV